MTTPTIDITDTITDVSATAWNAMVGHDDPFVEHAFLAGLESCGCVGTRGSGWLPRYFLLKQGPTPIAAMPFYEKYDSYGEYIFDWAWAEAAMRAGIAYYPKLVCAVPFTPVTGRRILRLPDISLAEVAADLRAGMDQMCAAIGASSTHILFLPADEREALTKHGFSPRASYQFHWENLAGWRSFDDYLGALRSSSRKQIRRERRLAHGHGLRLCMKPGPQLDALDWQAIWHFYCATCARKGAIAYLTEAFFAYLKEHFAQRVLVALAYRDRTPVAMALYFTKGKSLYGRYWGAQSYFEALHFELCYHQPIAYCLENGLTHFEAGAQGPHKVKRGLLPQPCHSVHCFRHPALAAAISDYLPREAEAIDEDMDLIATHSPFKRGS